MKVKIQANELHDADVTQIALVKHGAMRTPWKIIKSEGAEDETPGAVPENPEKKGFLSSVFKHFGATPEGVKIAAIYVKGDMSRYVRLLSEAGLVAGHSEQVGPGVTLVKTEDYTEQDLFPLAISEDIVVGLSGADALMRKVDAARSEYHEQLSVLRKHMPALVYKLDELLNTPFGGSTVEPEPGSKHDKEVEKMDKAREAVAGDHAGLEDSVTKSDAVTSEELAAAAATAETDQATDQTTDQTVEKSEDETSDASTENGDSVEKSDAVEGSTESEQDSDDPLQVIAEGMNNMFSMLDSMNARLEKQETRLETLASETTKQVQKAQEAAEEAQRVTRVVDWSIDESLSSQTRTRGDVKKAEESEDVFEGLLSGILPS